jgi:hypothetical protein
VMGIRFGIHLKEKVIHVSKCHLMFKTIEERKIQGTLLLADPKNSSSSKFVNSQMSDYNRCTNLLFVYQSTSLDIMNH